MEELFHMALSIFVIITIMKTVNIWDHIIYVTLHLFEIFIGVDVLVTKYESHKSNPNSIHKV